MCWQSTVTLIQILGGPLLYGYSVLHIESLIKLLITCYEKELTEI